MADGALTREEYNEFRDWMRKTYGEWSYIATIPPNMVGIAENPYYQYWINYGRPAKTTPIPPPLPITKFPSSEEGKKFTEWLTTQRGWEGLSTQEAMNKLALETSAEEKANLQNAYMGLGVDLTPEEQATRKEVALELLGGLGVTPSTYTTLPTQVVIDGKYVPVNWVTSTIVGNDGITYEIQVPSVPIDVLTTKGLLDAESAISIKALGETTYQKIDLDLAQTLGINISDFAQPIIYSSTTADLMSKLNITQADIDSNTFLDTLVSAYINNVFTSGLNQDITDLQTNIQAIMENVPLTSDLRNAGFTEEKGYTEEGMNKGAWNIITQLQTKMAQEALMDKLTPERRLEYEKLLVRAFPSIDLQATLNWIQNTPDAETLYPMLGEYFAQMEAGEAGRQLRGKLPTTAGLAGFKPPEEGKIPITGWETALTVDAAIKQAQARATKAAENVPVGSNPDIAYNNAFAQAMAELLPSTVGVGGGGIGVAQPTPEQIEEERKKVEEAEQRRKWDELRKFASMGKQVITKI